MVVLSQWPVCWRCQEKITAYYMADRTGKILKTLIRRWPMPLSALPVTFLCADCTDEMAEMNRP